MRSVFNKEFEDAVPVHHTDRRGGKRTVTLYRLVQIRSQSDEGLGRCRNLSDWGACLDLSLSVAPGDEIEVAFSESVSVAAHVVWTQQNRCGVAFLETLDSAALLAQTHKELRAARGRPPRLRADIAATVSYDDCVADAIVRDISQTGMKVTQSGFRPGLRLKILLDSGLERRAVVRWTREDEAGLMLLEPFSVEQLGSIRSLVGRP